MPLASARRRAAPRHPSHRPRLRTSTSAHGYRLDFSEGVRFAISADGRTIRIRRANGVPLDAVRRLLVAHVIPLVLGHLGAVVLHGSAVVTRAGAVAFLGRTGTGKSTLAASFALSGAALIADDAIVTTVSGKALFATPARLGLALWTDSMRALGARARDRRRGSAKHLLGERSGIRLAQRRQPIRRIYVLERSPSVRLEIAPMSARAAALALVSHSYTLDSRDRDRLSRQFATACAIVECVEMRRLRCPRRLDALESLRAAIARDLG